jgi:hypothetical protein
VQLFGINSNGDVFGTAVESGAQTTESFLLKAGSTAVQFLGRPGDQKNTQASSVALGINASDAVVGYTLGSARADLAKDTGRHSRPATRCRKAPGPEADAPPRRPALLLRLCGLMR